jgi:hypothetical protein
MSISGYSPWQHRFWPDDEKGRLSGSTVLQAMPVALASLEARAIAGRHRLFAFRRSPKSCRACREAPGIASRSLFTIRSTREHCPNVAKRLGRWPYRHVHVVTAVHVLVHIERCGSLSGAGARDGILAVEDEPAGQVYQHCALGAGLLERHRRSPPGTIEPVHHHCHHGVIAVGAAAFSQGCGRGAPVETPRPPHLSVHQAARRQGQTRGLNARRRLDRRRARVRGAAFAGTWP